METSNAPSATTAEPRALLTEPQPDHIELVRPKPNEPLPAKLVIDEVDVRTPAEEIEFQECQTRVAKGWTGYADAGAALMTIRDKKLYRNEHTSFEVYCREHWGFGHTKVWGYIAAAQIQKCLATIPDIPLPECQAQVQPLIGLPPELAQQAWLNAVSRTPENHVPARLVKRAVKALLKTVSPATTAEKNVSRKQRSRLRQSVRTGFHELLTLLLGTLEREVLIAKVQEIEHLLDPLLAPKKTKV